MTNQNPIPENGRPDLGQQPPLNADAQYGQMGQYGQTQPGQAPYGQAPYGQAQHDVAGSRYGTQPYDAAQGQYGAPVAEPKKFRTLLTLTLVSAALYALSGLLSLFADTDDATRQMLEAQGMSPDQIDQAMQAAGATGMISAIVTLLIGLGLYALVYFGLRSVKNWARILGIVFAIISVVLGVLGLLGAGALAGLGIGLGFSGPLGIVSMLLSVLTLIVNIVWLVHAFNKDVAAYTKQGSRVAA